MIKRVIHLPAHSTVQRALELDPECEEYEEALERLLRRIPEDCAAALRVREGQRGGRGGQAYSQCC